MMPVASQNRKSQYRPHIRKEAEGVYTVQSETYTYILYTQHVLDNGHVTCDCTAGQHGKPCKHSKAVAALVAYNAHPMHLRPVVTFAQLAEEFAALPVPDFDFRQTAPSFEAAPSAFAELFR